MLQTFKEKFGDCKNTGSQCTSKSSYELIDKDVFCVYDPPPKLMQPSRFVNAEEKHQLTVKNNSGSPVCFIKTDKCLFTDEIEKCDCIILNDLKIFLIEISDSCAGSRNKKRNKAVDQFISTLNELDANDIEYRKIETKKAIICFKHQNERPTKSSANTQRAVFKKTYQMELEEGQIIEF